jgi:hypothetical protein
MSALGLKVTMTALSGSTNSYPSITNANRRMLCLEPAHLGENPVTSPLSQEDQFKLTELDRDHSDKYAVELQDYTNHLYHLFVQEMPAEIHKALYHEAPVTEWMEKWMLNSSNNSYSTLLALQNDAEAFWSYLHLRRLASNDYDIDQQQFIACMQYFIQMYSYESSRKTSYISWEWFRAILLLTQAKPKEDSSKQDVLSALGDAKTLTPSQWSKDLHVKWNEAHKYNEKHQFVAQAIPLVIPNEVMDEHVKLFEEYLKQRQASLSYSDDNLSIKI